MEKESTNRTYITAILPCVNYSDYLIETLPTLKDLVDNIYIITTYDDIETQELCRKTSTNFIAREPTTPTFKRGVYINYGFKNITKKGWFLVTDADVAFPKKAKEIYNEQLDKKCLYGVLRHKCHKYSEWIDYQKNGTKYNWDILKSKPQVGMGYFQLFHTDNFKRKELNYPPYSVNDNGKGSDFYFSRNFKCRKRFKFFSVIHLENGKKGQNNHGRYSKTFQNSD